MQEVGDRPLAFSPEQRQALAALGVVPEQIEAVEDVLPECRAAMRTPAPMDDVRGELTKLSRAMDNAARTMSRLEGAREYQPALLEAFERIQTESFKLDSIVDSAGYDLIERAIDALTFAQACVDRATAGLPTEQRRRESPWWPVLRIHQALVLGWELAYYPSRHGKAPSGAAASAQPPFPHVPSMGLKKKPFRRVVSICYDVMRGQYGSDPERQIRAFCAWYGKQREAETSSDGQQGSGRSGLPP